MLMVAGVSELAAMRPSVGRPRLWSDYELLALAREFLEHGERWTSDHASWARKRGLERRNVLKLMRRAEAAGLVTIGKSRGAASANVYALTGLEPERVDAKARAEWHLRSWHELERRRGALERASASASNLAKGLAKPWARHNPPKRATKNPPFPAGSAKRMRGLEPLTFCMASRRSTN